MDEKNYRTVTPADFKKLSDEQLLDTVGGVKIKNKDPLPPQCPFCASYNVRTHNGWGICDPCNCRWNLKACGQYDPDEQV